MLYTGTATSLVLKFDAPLRTFGVELEPNFGVHTLTAQFLNGATPVGLITLAVDSFAGARLFAATTTDEVFTSVSLSATDLLGFALAQVHYSPASPQTPPPVVIPEPASLVLVGSSLLGYSWRRRRSRNAIDTE